MKVKTVTFLLALLCIIPLQAFAAEEISFNTKYTIVDGADNHFIAKDPTGKYGLLDAEGEDTDVKFDYDDMRFPEDTTQYHFVVVKQGENWGIVDYDGKELISPRYGKLGEYKDGNTIAAAYDGNKTYLYDQKGKEQKNKLSGDYTNVLSDKAFAGETDVRDDRGNQLLDLKEEGLLSSDPEDESKTESVVVGAGEDIAAQYYCGNNGVTFGNLRVDQYIKIYDSEGEEKREVVPNEQWAGDEDSTIEGSLILEKAISESSLLVEMKMPEDKDSFELIYDVENDRYSEKFKAVGVFSDHRAFAKDLDGKLIIIDDKGEEISKDDISIEGYKLKNPFGGKNAQSLKITLAKFVKDDDIKLYSLLKEKELDGKWKEAIYKAN